MQPHAYPNPVSNTEPDSEPGRDPHTVRHTDVNGDLIFKRKSIREPQPDTVTKYIWVAFPVSVCLSARDGLQYSNSFSI